VSSQATRTPLEGQPDTRTVNEYLSRKEPGSLVEIREVSSRPGKLGIRTSEGVPTHFRHAQHGPEGHR